MLVAVGRFFAHGWIHEYFYAPSHFFTYYGLGWVRPLAWPFMYVLFGGLAVCATLIVIGKWHRVAALVFALGFAYAHACDQTNYLNHYYLIVQVAVLLAFLPAGPTVPAWAVWAMRAQIGLVYFFGGVAKLGADWLLAGQPLATWLSANTDFPLVGAWFAEPNLALAASWAAAFFDLTIVGWLLWPRTRAVAYVFVVAFHLATAKLFHLGMFPWVMTAFATIFFAPDWPRRWWPAKPIDAVARPLPRLGLAVLGVHLAIQLLLPLRAHLYPGNRLWHEQGYRYAWNVMLMEKSGVADFRVHDPATGREVHVPASTYWTRYQATMMATQPDMLLAAAHVVADDFRARGVAAPEVRVDAFASLNGRPRQRLVDPTVDLAALSDGLAAKPWILPAP
jgi:vitamin K-dependent gamma-carboxylase